jgi:hypothetical protein
MAAAAPTRTTRRARTAGVAAVALVLALTTACSTTPSDADPTTAAPTPVPSSSTVAPSATAARSPSASPTATASGPAFALDDPATWTVSGAEVGPIALGGAVAAEVDDLAVAYDRDPGPCPGSPETSFWLRDGAPGLIVEARDGRVSGVAVTAAGPGATVEGGPTTAAGTGIGTSLEDLQAAYPDLQYSGTTGVERGEGSYWSVRSGSRFVTSTLGADGRVAAMWVGDSEQPPYEFCG